MTEFEILVEKMREAQIKYFATRDKGILNLSKQLEKQVDHELKHKRNPGLSGLFNLENEF